MPTCEPLDTFDMSHLSHVQLSAQAELAEHAEIAKKMLAVYERAWPEKTP
jgi:hypothetical protein